VVLGAPGPQANLVSGGQGATKGYALCVKFILTRACDAVGSGLTLIRHDLEARSERRLEAGGSSFSVAQ